MSEWTREHDKVIAERCEGLRTALVYPDGLTFVNDDGTFLGAGMVPHYNTDIAACFRAAEAWRKQHATASWTLGAGIWGRDTTTAQLSRSFVPLASCESENPAAALAQALYEAVKDA